MARRKNVLTGRTAAVAVNRNGLSVQIDAVPAIDAALVAAALLRMMRSLERAGFEELVPEGSPLHAGGYDQAEEPDDEDFSLPPSARKRAPEDRRIGFVK